MTGKEGRRSEALVDRCRERLERSMEVRFVHEASAGTLTEPHFARYLAIEEGFVQTAVRVNAYCLYAEPDWSRVPQHGASVAALLGEQLEYFAGTRPAHADTSEAISRALANAQGLSRYVMRLIESHGYAGAVVSMFAAETLYSEWCAKAARERRLNAGDDVDAWIALHATREFRSQVEAIATLVDALPRGNTRYASGIGGSDEQLELWFSGMLESEDRFHESIYFEEE
jgi:thiaminase/transcriptional activator TenA